MNPFKKITLYVLIIIFILFYCNSLFSQEQTVVKVKKDQYSNFEIELFGKVKSVMIISHYPDYSCDTKKAKFDEKFNRDIRLGEVIEIVCSADTLLYFLDTNSIPIEIYESHYSINVFNIKNHYVKIYKLINGKISNELRIVNNVIDKKLINEYDTNNNLIVTLQYWDVLNLIDSLQYDPHNNLIKKTEYRTDFTDNPNIEFRSSETFEYDSLNHLKIEMNSINKNTYYEYDSCGNKIIEGSRKIVNSKNLTYEYIPYRGYVYNDKNKLIKSFTIGERPIKYITNYKYDDKGRKIEVIEYYIKKDTSIYFHQVFEYNKEDKLTKKEEKVGNGFWTEIGFGMCKEILYQYDQYGNIVQQENNYCQSYKDNIVLIRYFYTYDSHGNWIKKETWMGKTKDKLERTKIEDRIIEYY